MKNLSLVMILSSFAISAIAFASPTQGNGGAAGQAPGLRFEDVRTACKTPSHFHNQIAPTFIQVSCKDVQSKWIAASVGSTMLPSAREVGSTVITDKSTAVSVSAPVAAFPQSVACPSFKEVTETIETVRTVTCDEVMNFSGNGIDFCVSVTNSMRAVNPEAVVIVPTGNVVNPCGENNGQNPGNGQRN